MTLSNWKHRRVSMAERPQPYDRVGTKGASSALSRRGECATDVDQVIGDDAQADPALDAGQAFVATAVQAMAALEETDPAFAACAPLLSVAEPAFLLEPLSLRTALGREVGDGDSLDAADLRGERIAMREKGGIGGEQIRHATQKLPMHVKSGKQQIAVRGTLRVDLVVRDDLRFGFLDLHHLAELGGLGGFALTDHLGVRLEEAHELAGNVRVALEEALTCLMHDLAHQGDHPLKVGFVCLQAQLIQKAAGALAPRGNEAKRFIDDSLVRDPLNPWSLIVDGWINIGRGRLQGKADAAVAEMPAPTWRWRSGHRPATQGLPKPVLGLSPEAVNGHAPSTFQLAATRK